MREKVKSKLTIVQYRWCSCQTADCIPTEFARKRTWTLFRLPTVELRRLVITLAAVEFRRTLFTRTELTLGAFCAFVFMLISFDVDGTLFNGVIIIDERWIFRVSLLLSQWFASGRFSCSVSLLFVCTILLRGSFLTDTLLFPGSFTCLEEQVLIESRFSVLEGSMDVGLSTRYSWLGLFLWNIRSIIGICRVKVSRLARSCLCFPRRRHARGLLWVSQYYNMKKKIIKFTITTNTSNSNNSTELTGGLTRTSRLWGANWFYFLYEYEKWYYEHFRQIVIVPEAFVVTFVAVVLNT